jgi:hypothetical protein
LAIIHIEHICTFFVTFFSATIDGRNLIFGHKLHIGTPYCGKCFLDPSDSYFLFADFIDFYTHWTYMLIFPRIFLSNCWWQKFDISSQASYRYPISWEVFLDPSDSYFLFADLVGFYTYWTYIYCFTSVRPSVCPSVRPRYLSPHFYQQLLMAEIWYLVTSFIYNVGMPYCGKRFWTCQIPTSCLPT